MTIHFVVEPAGVTQVMPGAVSSPERGSSCSTVHTLSAFRTGSGLASRLGGEAGRGAPQKAARVEEAAAVVVGGRHVGRVSGDGVVGGGLGPHAGEAAPERAGALHLHPLRQRHLVLDAVFVLLPGPGGGRRGGGAGGVGVRGHFLGRGRGEAEEVGAGVRGRGERRHRGGAGRAAAWVHRDGPGRSGRRGVQGCLGEGVDGPGVVVMGRQCRLAAVQPRDPGAVDKMRPAHLTPGQAGVCLAVGDPGPGMGGIGVVGVALRVQVVEEDVDFIRR